MGKLKQLVFIYVLCVFSQNCCAQNYQITYEIVYQPNKIDSTKEKSTYLLNINPETNVSLFSAMSKDDMLNMKVYKDFSSDSFIKYESLSDISYRMNYDFEPNWILTNETKIIRGYESQKAEIAFGGRTWEAWYTKEIPFQNGPYKFSGLPGLIMEIYSIDHDYHFTAVSIERKESGVIEKLKAIPFQNEEQEKKYKMEIVADPALQYRKNMAQLKSQNMGIRVTFNSKEITPKDSERMIVEEFREWKAKHNNPIEKDMIWIK